MPDFSTLLGGALVDVVSTPTGSEGVTVGPHASVNTKGSWTELLAATTMPASWVLVNTYPGAVNRYLLDIGVGASTVEKVLIPDLYVAVVGTVGEAQIRSYLFPISIPSGTRLSARVASSTAASALAVNMQLVSPTLLGSAPLSRVEACGIVPASTRLTAIDPGASTNTDSGWVELLASTGFPYKWMCITSGHGASATGGAASYLLDIGIGALGVEKVLIADLLIRNHTAVDEPTVVFSLPVSVPAGRRLSARLRSTYTNLTDRILDIGAWGVG